jgi:hypothetical protein
LNIDCPGNWERGRGERGLSPGRTGSFTVPPKNSAPAEKYYSARCKVLHGALQSVSPNAENLAFLFSLSELPYYKQVVVACKGTKKRGKNQKKNKLSFVLFYYVF